MIERHDALERQRALVAKGERFHDRFRLRLEGALAAAAAAEQQLLAAENALEAARTADAAAAVAAHLHPGDQCLVCGNRVEQLPRFDGAGVRAATAAQKAAAKAATAATTDRQDAELELARIEARLDAERARLDELAEQVAAGPPRADAEAALAAAAAAGAAVTDARNRRSAHHKAIETARALLRRSDEQRSAAWQAFDRARDALARLEPPPAARRDPAEDWAALATWAATTELDVLRRLAAAEGERDRLAERQRARTAELLDAAQAVLPDAHTLRTVADVRDRSLAAEGRIAAELTRLEADRRRAAEVQRELDGAVEAEQVASMVTQLLRANRFGAWILDEAVQQLVEGATGLLQRLSGGAYSLVLDGKDFAVIDHNNADAIRSARTLSGGETFLASLALALALADQVVMLAGPTAAPLESLFLDEGFGTLDPDTLDTVASAIEELGSAGRMVGIVTHVRDLAERLPVRYEVTKDADGARVERVLA
ncbi:MAG: SbcC/MukB-like Walker B domain-containing protein [Acidimicrobiales bacterium]